MKYVCILLILLSACSHAEELEIGVITALSGENAVQGEWTIRGLELAQEDINTAGGVHGLPVRLVYEDSAFQPNKALTAAQKLIETHQVSALITQSGASSTLAIAPYATQSGVVHMEVLCIVRACQTENDLLFRVSGPPEDQLKFLVDHLIQEDYASVGVLYINNDYGVYQYSLLQQLFDGRIVGEAFEQGEVDFRSLLTKIDAQSIDVLLILSFPHETSRILKQHGELGFVTPTLGTITSENARTLDVAGRFAEGHQYAYYKSNFDEGIGREYYQRYLEYYNEQPEMFGAKSYDALLVLAHAMNRCSTLDSDCISENILAIRDLHGVSDVLRFNVYGDVASEQFELKEIRNGRFVVSSQY